MPTTEQARPLDPELLEALRVLVQEGIGDWIYDIRERAATSGDGFDGNSWDHPRVVAFSNAVSVIGRVVKEAGTQ